MEGKMNIPNIEVDSHVYKDFSFFTKGGMGEIYKGIEAATKQTVILKLIFIENENFEELLKKRN